jgi:chromate transport protein ChrA
MSNERRGGWMAGLVAVVIGIWATTALLSIAIRALHVFTSIALTVAIGAALVALVLRAMAGLGRSGEEEH